MHATHSGKRSGYLSWDDYFMAVALLSAQRSKDPNTQVGACIVNPKNASSGSGTTDSPPAVPMTPCPGAAREIFWTPNTLTSATRNSTPS
jgi:deoxycytidylate deaminase